MKLKIRGECGCAAGRYETVAAYLLVLIFFLSGAPPAWAQNTQRLALVIGNDSYTSISPLHNATSDARAIAVELQAAGFDVTSRQNLDYRETVRLIGAFVQRVQAGDEVALFFAGHGVQLKSGNYLLPVDIEATSENEVERTAIGLDDLMDQIKSANPRFTLLIVDACRDNPFPRQGTRSIGETRGLRSPEPPRGQMVVFSAGRGQTAIDRLSARDTDPNGLFTREFLKQMRNPGVAIENVMREVQDAVERQAATVGHEQRPSLYTEARGDFYFHRAAGSATPAGSISVPDSAPPSSSSSVRLQSAEEIEQQAWNAAQSADTATAYGAYLREYDRGRFAGAARIRLAASQTAAPQVREASPAALPSMQAPQQPLLRPAQQPVQQPPVQQPAPQPVYQPAPQPEQPSAAQLAIPVIAEIIGKLITRQSAPQAVPQTTTQVPSQPAPQIAQPSASQPIPQVMQPPVPRTQVATMATTQPANSPSSRPFAVRYAGCFRDQGDPGGTAGRDLSGAVRQDATMTTQMCASECRARGYVYAGTQAGTWCFCGNHYGATGTASNCDMSCGGNTGEKCGGAWANSVYQVAAPLAHQPAGGGIVTQPARVIQVVAGTYGANCRQPRGNRTEHLSSVCNGRDTCEYVVNHQVIGDPASGCAKNYVAEWQCAGTPRILQTGAAPEAGFGSRILLSCRN